MSIVAWLGILSGAVGTLGCIGFALAVPNLRAFILLLSCVATLVTSLGLRARKEWARQGFMLVLAYGAVMGVIGAFTAHAPQMRDFPTVPGAPTPPITQAQLDAMWESARTSTRVMGVVGAGFSALMIMAFSSMRVRREFGGDSAV